MNGVANFVYAPAELWKQFNDSSFVGAVEGIALDSVLQSVANLPTADLNSDW